MNDYSDPSKFLLQIKTSDSVPIYTNYYQLRSKSEMICDLEKDTGNVHYILDSPFSSKVWSLMLTLFDQARIDRTKLFPPKEVKFRELVDFMDFYQITQKEEYYDTMFEYFIAKEGNYDRVRELADELDSGKIEYRFYAPSDYPFPGLASPVDLNSLLYKISAPVPVAASKSFFETAINSLNDPLMLAITLITIAGIYSRMTK